jgi:hypothetical protein
VLVIVGSTDEITKSQIIKMMMSDMIIESWELVIIDYGQQTTDNGLFNISVVIVFGCLVKMWGGIPPH